jgi:hypothetical protein
VQAHRTELESVKTPRLTVTHPARTWTALTPTKKIIVSFSVSKLPKINDTVSLTRRLRFCCFHLNSLLFRWRPFLVFGICLVVSRTVSTLGNNQTEDRTCSGFSFATAKTPPKWSTASAVVPASKVPSTRRRVFRRAPPWWTATPTTRGRP